MNSNPNIGRFDESDMTLLDDPRLTAYALGELDDAERVEVETLLAASAEARAVVAEIQLLSGAFVAGLQAEPALTLSVAQREAVSAAVGTWEGEKVGTTVGMAAESVAPVSNRCEAQRVDKPLTQPLVENQCHKLQVSEQPLVESQCNKDGGSSAGRLVTLKHPVAWFALKATVGVAASVLLVGALTWSMMPTLSRAREIARVPANEMVFRYDADTKGKERFGKQVLDQVAAVPAPASPSRSAGPAGGVAAASARSESAGVAVAQAALTTGAAMPSADGINIPDARLLPHFRYTENPPTPPQVGQPVVGVGEAGRGFARGEPAPGAAVIGGGGCLRFYFTNPGSSAGLTDSSLALKNTDGSDTDGATYALTGDIPAIGPLFKDNQAGEFLELGVAFDGDSAGMNIQGINLNQWDFGDSNMISVAESPGHLEDHFTYLIHQSDDDGAGDVLYNNSAYDGFNGLSSEDASNVGFIVAWDANEPAFDSALVGAERSLYLMSVNGTVTNKQFTVPPFVDNEVDLRERLLFGGDECADSLLGAKSAGWEGYPELGDFDVYREPIFLGRELQLLGEPTNTTRFAEIVENEFNLVGREPLSTFSIDVDTAAYSIVRRNLNDGQLPPPDAVRVEELLNYFDYDYEAPAADDDQPFAANVEFAACPWNAAHQLVRVGLKGRVMDAVERPVSNLVFLVDVSGSMNQPNKLPLVQQGLRMLVEQLDERDHVAMVVYAGNAGLVLDSTPAGDQAAILAAIDRLQSGGSTHGSAGIAQAYEVATANFVEGGVNRVILCTDGDFNVGVTSHDELIKLIEDKAKSGVFLSVLGFGYDNLNDKTLEQLADKGNGNYAYIDTLSEARKVLVDQLTGTLVTIAKDVKIQIEFNPAVVAAYRLIGYENRVLAAQDFNDDTKDAGEIGAGHSVTALYEVLPADPAAEIVFPPPPVDPMIDPLKYQTPLQLARVATQPADCLEALTLKLRYKAPDGDVSQLVEYEAYDGHAGFDEASDDFRFAAAVAGFGMQLRGSEHRGDWTLADVAAVAADAVAGDPFGYRAEFIGLVKHAEELSRQGEQQKRR